jgi:hypothetical protein
VFAAGASVATFLVTIGAFAAHSSHANASTTSTNPSSGLTSSPDGTTSRQPDRRSSSFDDSVWGDDNGSSVPAFGGSSGSSSNQLPSGGISNRPQTTTRGS